MLLFLDKHIQKSDKVVRRGSVQLRKEDRYAMQPTSIDCEKQHHKGENGFHRSDMHCMKRMKNQWKLSIQSKILVSNSYQKVLNHHSEKYNFKRKCARKIKLIEYKHLALVGKIS